MICAHGDVSELSLLMRPWIKAYASVAIQVLYSSHSDRPTAKSKSAFVKLS